MLVLVLAIPLLIQLPGKVPGEAAGDDQTALAAAILVGDLVELDLDGVPFSCWLSSGPWGHLEKERPLSPSLFDVAFQTNKLF